MFGLDVLDAVAIVLLWRPGLVKVKGRRLTLCVMTVLMGIVLWCAVLCRRWNNTVGLTLRAVIYDPIVEGCWIHREPAGSAAAAVTAHGAAPAGPEDAATQPSVSQQASTTTSNQPASSGPPKVPALKRLAGTAATFAVSGLMHELILLYALHEGNSYPAGFWFMFFFIQVGCAAGCLIELVRSMTGRAETQDDISMAEGPQRPLLAKTRRPHHGTWRNSIELLLL